MTEDCDFEFGVRGILMRTLENTTLSWMYDLTRSNGDEDFFDKISILMTVFVLAATALSIIRPVAYGKSAVISKHPKNVVWSYNLSSKFVWRVGTVLYLVRESSFTL